MAQASSHNDTDFYDWKPNRNHSVETNLNLQITIRQFPSIQKLQNLLSSWKFFAARLSATFGSIRDTRNGNESYIRPWFNRNSIDFVVVRRFGLESTTLNRLKVTNKTLILLQSLYIARTTSGPVSIATSPSSSWPLPPKSMITWGQSVYTIILLTLPRVCTPSIDFKQVANFFYEENSCDRDVGNSVVLTP